LEVVPEVSTSAVACDELSKPCPGLAVYQEVKDGLEEARVIFSTHTMFCLWALQIRTGRPALFVRFDAVFIDEAHQLEETLASCTGSELSIRHLHSSIREGYGRKEVYPRRWHQIEAQIGKCQDELMTLPDDYLVPAGVAGAGTTRNFTITPRHWLTTQRAPEFPGQSVAGGSIAGAIP
jgi:Rad3-related DNA helicase